jgi:hypothetical protein
LQRIYDDALIARELEEEKRKKAPEKGLFLLAHSRSK